MSNLRLTFLQKVGGGDICTGHPPHPKKWGGGIYIPPSPRDLQHLPKAVVVVLLIKPKTCRHQHLSDLSHMKDRTGKQLRRGQETSNVMPCFSLIWCFCNPVTRSRGIQCDGCDTWFHTRCIGMESKEYRHRRRSRGDGGGGGTSVPPRIFLGGIVPPPPRFLKA